MSPIERVLGLVAPDRSRWRPMLLGLGVAIVCIQAVALLEPPDFVSAILVVVVFLAWAAGALAMVGYVRWFFAADLSQAKRDKAASAKDGK